MTTEFDDELLSAVLDGEADPQTVAAVHADPDAAARLRSMQAAASLVGTPPAPATPERRAASIAAALAAAQPAPEVSSLSVARERKATAAPTRRPKVNWLAIAAAFAFVLVSAVVLTNVVGGGDADTVDTATDAADAAEEATDDSASFDAAVAESADAMEDDAIGETAMAEATDAMEDTEAMEETMVDDAMEEEDAMEDDGDDSADEAADAAVTTTSVATRTVEPFATNNVLLLEEAIDIGTVVPVLQLTDPELIDVVNPECLAGLDTPPDIDQFALAELGEFAPPPQLVVVQFDPFDPTQVIGIFDAEDCSPVG